MVYGKTKMVYTGVGSDWKAPSISILSKDRVKEYHGHSRFIVLHHSKEIEILLNTSLFIIKAEAFIVVRSYPYR